METVWIVVQQTLTMFLYMMAGYILFRTKKLTPAGTKDIATLLLWLVIPAVLINSFRVECTAQRLEQLVFSFLLGALSIAVAALIARLLFGASPIDRFAASFSNAGFVGIPLVQAAFGSEAVFYIVGIIALLNLVQWTYGVAILTKEPVKIRPKELLASPMVIGVIVGLVLFLTGAGTRLPAVLAATCEGVSALNAPLAMLILGSYLAQADLKKMVRDLHLYCLCAVRLLVVPAATLLVFLPLPLPTELKLSLFIAASAPAGANVAVYSQLHDLDYPYACQTVAMSTLLSVITIPAMLFIAQRIF